jgi:hypothetical protein
VTIAEYFEAIKERLVTEPIIVSFQITRERKTLVDGYLRARLRLINDNELKFSEYAQRLSSGQIEVVTYSYHWAKTNHELIRRWDNTPHHPNLTNFPHHVHDGITGTVLPGYPMSIFAVLDEIAGQIIP